MHAAWSGRTPGGGRQFDPKTARPGGERSGCGGIDAPPLRRQVWARSASVPVSGPFGDMAMQMISRLDTQRSSAG